MDIFTLLLLLLVLFNILLKHLLNKDETADA